jgi:hypothetical protein
MIIFKADGSADNNGVQKQYGSGSFDLGAGDTTAMLDDYITKNNLSDNCIFFELTQNALYFVRGGKIVPPQS